MEKQHHYSVSVKWTGNKGEGTSDYRNYERSHTISSEDKEDIFASSDSPFRGDTTKHNPETLLLSALSSCHMLWYLHLCADAGVIVTDYIDNAKGTMVEPGDKAGHFSDVTLYPVVTVTEKSMVDKANDLHIKAHDRCFIANSVNFPVHHSPLCLVKEG